MLKKTFLLAIVVLLSLGAVSAQDAPNPWRQFEGTTIVVSWPSLYHFQVAQTLIPEFEELTGITVEVDSVQYESMHDKQVLEMSKPGGGDYDVVSWVIFWKTEYVNKGFLRPMAEFFTNPDLVMPDYDAADLIPAYLESGSVVGGRRAYLPGVTAALYGVPFSGETSVLVYRKDIFDEYDLKVPETYDELLETAEWITANVPNMYGITSRGAAGHQIVHAWLLHLSPYGGSVLDDNWNPVVNSEAGVAAAEALKRILDASPPGVTSYGIGEASNSFLQGEAAMFLDNDRIINQTRDPNQSRIDGKIGVALHPTAVTCGAETGGFAIGIPTNARNPEAAFMFIQWMTSKETDRKLAKLGGQPGRMSTLLDPEMQAMYPEYPVIAKQLECANVDWRPLIAEWGALNAPILGVQLSEFVTGQKTAQEALDEAARLIREELTRAGYYNWMNLPGMSQ